MEYLSNKNNITLYQIVQYLNTMHGAKIQHDKVMSRQMPKWLAISAFGPCAIIGELLNRGDMGGTQEIATYKLTKRQCISVAGSLSMRYQSIIIDRLHELELKYDPANVTQDGVRGNLYRLTQYLVKEYGVKSRHTDLMRNNVKKWVSDGLGEVEYVTINVQVGATTRDIATVNLTNRQSVMVSGSLSMLAQLAMIDRLQYLEVTYDPDNISSEILAEAVCKWDAFNDGVILHGVCGVSGLNVADGARFYFRDDAWIGAVAGTGKPLDWSTVTWGQGEY